MASRTMRRNHGAWIAALAGLFVALGPPALAQERSRPDAGAVAVAAGLELANVYVFRGVRQNSTGLAVAPYVELTATVLSGGDGLFRGVDIGGRSWNSVHSGDTGSGGPVSGPWYEARVSGAVTLRFGAGVSLASSYTAYTSPNELFQTVKEIGVTLAMDGGGIPGAAAVRPYAHVAFELDAAPGMGQLDGGLAAGRYLELGAMPRFSRARIVLVFPVKVGASLGNYYEVAGRDHAFGFVSVGTMATIPLDRRSRWLVHAGVEWWALGHTPRVFNGGDRSTLVASFGFGLRR